MKKNGIFKNNFFNRADNSKSKYYAYENFKNYSKLKDQ